MAPADHQPPRTSSGSPVVGSLWRERRRDYAARTVRVLDTEWFEYGNGFVHITTVTLSNGQAPSRRVRTRVRQALWHTTFTPAEEADA